LEGTDGTKEEFIFESFLKKFNELFFYMLLYTYVYVIIDMNYSSFDEL